VARTVRFALITGANKGIGFEIARRLGKQGFLVFIGSRDQEQGEKAAAILQSEGIRALAVQLDVTVQSSVNAAAAFIESNFDRLDVLVNNAGVLLENVPPSELDVEVLKNTYDTNVFGMFRVIKAMLPLLRKSEQGRIVNMSSSLGSLQLNGDLSFDSAGFLMLGYNSSKTAVNAMTVFFANELKGTRIKVNSADPGYCATDLTNHGGLRSAYEGAKAAVYLAALPDDGPTGGFFDENGRLPW
jgi:NAD(P)-dependent dehydrogenase (short-subunit alcohol dehydrogenase family)